ncbi:ninjurin-1 isoform X2 [Coregonus clupeaformis]|uniref:ninjurin-1 isoform X2 n=1 Tax=Coregonus clupeaformis TaxID=59861 RepID=UPI001BDFFA44|nr:ninjurin-1 isoform X2 [Coregonus clupeaformis]
MASENMEMNGSANRESGGEERRPGRLSRRPAGSPINMNQYANKKSAAESMLDVALLMANASQLKAVLEQGPEFTFYTPLITFISVSLILQITVGVLLIFIGPPIVWVGELKNRTIGDSVCISIVFLLSVGSN